MNQSLLNLATLLKNPHLRYPVLAIAAIEIAKIWLPACQAQLNGTQKIITFYLVAAAANSAPQTSIAAPPATPAQSTETKP